MKPDWKDAPAWANYLAMDESGAWTWFSMKPAADGGDINNFGIGIWVEGEGIYVPAEASTCRWHSTLEQRPTGSGGE